MEENFQEYDFFKTKKELLKEAKDGIKGNVKCSMTINFLFFLIKLFYFTGLVLLILSLVTINDTTFNSQIGLIISGVFLLITAFFYGPLKLSVCKNCINMVENTNPSINDLKYGFKNYSRSLAYGFTLFFSYIFNLILLIIPFFNKYINSQFSGYFLAQDDNLKVGEAFKLSAKYIKGFKKKYISLVTMFIPKFLLCIISLYVYSLWVRPQFNTVVYCLYKDLKD